MSFYTNPENFQGTVIEDVHDERQVERAKTDARVMVLSVLDAILRRSERDAAYPFIDTKLSVVTGRDFDGADPIRSRDTIFGWIQGRALEALAGHCEWIARADWLDEPVRRDLDGRIRRVLSRAVDAMERNRLANAGRFHFMMTPKGRPLAFVDGRLVPAETPADAPATMSEMFYCKGLVAAGRLLGREDLLHSGCEVFDHVVRDVRSGRFVLDQQSFDPRNPVRPVPGRTGHSSRMIGIGAAARFLESTRDPAYAALGLEFIAYVLARHVNVSPPFACGEAMDMWEFHGPDDRPFVEGGVVRSDSGHATEFVGLSLKHIALAESLGLVPPAARPRVERMKAVLPEVLKKNFANGFSPRGFGIVKAFDLVSRKPLNDQMPWWNLPETIRAGVLACRTASGEVRDPCAEIAARSGNAFVRHWVKRELGLMAPQTLDADGQVIDVIPASPDADPGYHTGLSLIDCI